jgi:hypothetical protein
MLFWYRSSYHSVIAVKSYYCQGQKSRTTFLFWVVYYNIYLIRSYPRIVEIKYYIYIYVQNKKPLNMKYTEKNKLQYWEENNRKNYKIIAKMFGRRFFIATEIYRHKFYGFCRAFDGASFETKIKVLSFS